MSKSEKEVEQAGLDLLDDVTLSNIVDAAVAEYGDDLNRYPTMAEVAFEELARRSGYTIPVQ